MVRGSYFVAPLTRLMHGTANANRPIAARRSEEVFGNDVEAGIGYFENGT